VSRAALRPEVIAAGARAAGMTYDDVISRSRYPRLAHGRFAIILAIRESAKVSLSEIAEAVGKRDHTTIINAVRRAGDMRANDKRYAALCKRIRKAMDKAAA
jgi:chromosomal replication initiator protein